MVERVERVAAIRHRGQIVTFCFKKENMGLQEIYLVVGPKNLIHGYKGIKVKQNVKATGFYHTTSDYSTASEDSDSSEDSEGSEGPEDSEDSSVPGLSAGSEGGSG